MLKEIKGEKINASNDRERERMLQSLTGAVICASIKTQTKCNSYKPQHNIAAVHPSTHNALPFHSAEIDCINTLAFPMGYLRNLKYLRKCRKSHLKRDVSALSIFLCVRKKKH